MPSTEQIVGPLLSSRLGSVAPALGGEVHVDLPDGRVPCRPAYVVDDHVERHLPKVGVGRGDVESHVVYHGGRVGADQYFGELAHVVYVVGHGRFGVQAESPQRFDPRGRCDAELVPQFGVPGHCTLLQAQGGSTSRPWRCRGDARPRGRAPPARASRSGLEGEVRRSLCQAAPQLRPSTRPGSPGL